MEKVRFSRSDLTQLRQLGFGAIAEVYKLNEELVLKVFKKTNHGALKEESFIDKVGIKNETCVFPKFLAEIDGEFQGYLMDYIEGEMLGDVVKKLDLTLLIAAIQKAENDIKDLSKDKIIFDDVNQGSLMWTKDNQIKVVDTDFYFKDKDISEEEASRHNLESFHTMLEMETGFLNGPINSFLKSKKEYNDCYTEYMKASIAGKPISITLLLLKAVEVFQKEFGVTPRSIEEMETILKEHNLYIETDRKEASLTQGNGNIPIFSPPTKSNGHMAKNERKPTQDWDER